MKTLFLALSFIAMMISAALFHAKRKVALHLGGLPRLAILALALLVWPVLAMAEGGGAFTVPEAEPTTIYAAAFAVLWSLSELLAFMPKVKANGVFQAIVNILKSLAGKQ